MRAHCWLRSNLTSTSSPKSFPTNLLSRCTGAGSSISPGVGPHICPVECHDGPSELPSWWAYGSRSEINSSTPFLFSTSCFAYITNPWTPNIFPFLHITSQLLNPLLRRIPAEEHYVNEWQHSFKSKESQGVCCRNARLIDNRTLHRLCKNQGAYNVGMNERELRAEWVTHHTYTRQWGACKHPGNSLSNTSLCQWLNSIRPQETIEIILML